MKINKMVWLLISIFVTTSFAMAAQITRTAPISDTVRSTEIMDNKLIVPIRIIDENNNVNNSSFDGNIREENTSDNNTNDSIIYDREPTLIDPSSIIIETENDNDIRISDNQNDNSNDFETIDHPDINETEEPSDNSNDSPSNTQIITEDRNESSEQKNINDQILVETKRADDTITSPETTKTVKPVELGSESSEKINPPNEENIKTVPQATSDNNIDNQAKNLILEETPEMEIIEKNDLVNLEIDYSKKDIGAELFICNLGPSCSGDMGSTHWAKEAYIKVDDAKRGLSWEIIDNEIKIDSGLLQISHFPFEENKNNNIIHTKNINLGVSVFDFAILFASNQSNDNQTLSILDIESLAINNQKDIGLIEANITTTEIQKSLWEEFVDAIIQFFNKGFEWVKELFVETSHLDITDNQSVISEAIRNLNFNTYYLRVIPMHNGKIAGKSTDQIKVTLNPPSDNDESFEFYTPSKIYEVKIKDFQPIKGPSPDVCTQAIILDDDWVKPKIGGGTEVIPKGTRICPPTYNGQGEEAWYESLWNTIKSGVNWVSAAYNQLKSAVVDTVGGLACAGNEECMMAVSAGFDIGLAAMGIPPSLPNFDQLLDEGFDYLASEIATQAGCPDEACKILIKKGLETALKQNKNTNPSCGDVEYFHSMGVEPLCLPSNVKAHLDPEATYRNANATLEITRNYAEGSTSGIMGTPFKVSLYNLAYNDKPVGSWIHNIEPYGKSMQITEPLKDNLFEAKVINIPELQKGQSIEIPINLIAKEYWVPGHQELMEGWSTVTYKDGWPQYQYDDWWKLYYNGNLTLYAHIDGCEYNYGMESCIISSDSKNYALPNTLNP